ncbi:MAG: hypothetical protein P4M04_00020, partial [Acidobacteriota bacterium]|nr:hypothetical protein [Acidobacteriota bacterium]
SARNRRTGWHCHIHPIVVGIHEPNIKFSGDWRKWSSIIWQTASQVTQLPPALAVNVILRLYGSSRLSSWGVAGVEPTKKTQPAEPFRRTPNLNDTHPESKV